MEIYSQYTDNSIHLPLQKNDLVDSDSIQKNKNAFCCLPFEVKREVELSIVQYKIIHNISNAKSILYNMKKTNKQTNPFCPYWISKNEQTTKHLFCSRVSARCQIALAKLYRLE